MHHCCKRAYTRGSYIASGTCSDPGKSYHLEFSLPDQALAQRLFDILTALNLNLAPGLVNRKTNTVIYFKESESIADVLAIMEAHKSMLKFENMRVVKDMRNDVNRKVNFETANLSKTVNAAVSQKEDITYVIESVGLGYLPKPLEEVARLRLSYGSASLQEIGAMLDPPIGKSGVNHRLRKIGKIAETLREEKSKHKRYQ
jgi:hypothetical protein